MFTANDARKLMNDYNQQVLENLHRKIQKNAEMGFDFVHVPCEEMNDYSKQALIKEGYLVIGPSFSEYTIRW